MVYKTCSVKKVLAQIYRDFKPSNSGWIDDSIEWIGDAIGIMKCAVSYTEVSKDLEVLDYRLKIPCNLDYLLGISYNGFRLRFNGGVALKRKWSTPMPYCGDTFTLNPNYITTSFKEGCIRIHYLGTPVDCDGYPEVIDSAIYREALTWYVLMKMIGRGFKHQTFDYKFCMGMWEKTYPKAQNECKMPSIDQMENWKHNWIGVVKNLNRADVFYRTNGSNIVNQAHNPGDLLQSFKILGDRTE